VLGLDLGGFDAWQELSAVATVTPHQQLFFQGQNFQKGGVAGLAVQKPNRLAET
jgi:hypothetical protein